MAKSLEVLAQYRDALLVAEVAAWLHDFWKCTDEHVEYAASDRSAGLTDTYRTKYLSLLGSQKIALPGEPSILLRTLVEEYMKIKDSEIVDLSKPWLARVLKLCHNVAHTEKETVYHLIKQKRSDTRRGNPFGYESEHLVQLQETCCARWSTTGQPK